MKEKKNEIILFENQGVKLEVNMKDDTVWLNRQQMAELFNRDVKTIGKSDYFGIEDMELINELINLLSKYDSAYIKFEMIIKALNLSIEDFLHCKNNNIVFKELQYLMN